MGSFGEFRRLDTPSFGIRFRVQSRRGNQYVVRYLHHNESGAFVRLDNGKIARLVHTKVRWGTFEVASDVVKPVVAEGDEVLVECPGKVVQGKLREPLGQQEVFLTASDGSDWRIPQVKITSLSLLFRAPELMKGDRFLVRSTSGREYSGSVLGVGSEGITVRLEDDQEVSLRMDRLDLTSLYVPLPVPLE